MASWGLLGAVAGAGKAMVDLGADITKRREDALKWAREEAVRQQERQDSLDKEERGYRFQILQEDAKQTNALERVQATGRENRATEQMRQQGRVEIEGIRRDSQLSLEEKRQQGREALARLRGGIERSNSQAAIRLREQLSSDNVDGVEYVNPRTRKINGVEVQEAQVMLINKDGSTKTLPSYVAMPTSRRTRPPSTGGVTGSPLAAYLEDDEEDEDQ